MCSFFFFNTLTLQVKRNLKYHFLMQKKREKKLLAQMVSDKVEDTINRLKLYWGVVCHQCKSSGSHSQDWVGFINKVPFASCLSAFHVTCHCNIQTLERVYKWILLNKKAYPFCSMYYLFSSRNFLFQEFLNIVWSSQGKFQRKGVTIARYH